MAKKSKKNNTVSQKPKPIIKKAKLENAPSFWGNQNAVISVLAVLIVTFACFYNTLDNQFVNWDDDRNFYENEHIVSLNKENFWNNTKKIFTSKVIGNYNPLTIWTFAIEKQIYGFENPGKWHLTNVLLHLICVFLIFRISILLGLKWRGALFVAFLFGIHPMRVESVAWVTERKDVLFGMFYLWALMLYVKGKLKAKTPWIPILLLFVLSLFCKIQAVILPLSMLIVDFYFNKEITKKDISQKLPFFALSLLFGILGIVFLKDQGSLESAETYPVWQRIFVGSYSYMIYLIKSIIPFRMSPMYPYPPTMPAYFYPTIILGPAVLYGLYKTYIGKKTVWFFGLAFFTFNIMFLLQILGAGQGFIADRFTYIAYFGIFFVMGYFLDKFLESPKWKWPAVGVSVFAVVLYGLMTIQQNQVWQNSETLWTHVLQYYKKTTLPYGNRANYLRQEGRIDEALTDYTTAIELDPTSAQTYNSRARLYFDNAKDQETLIKALNDYTKAIELKPGDGEFHSNRGATFARLGDVDRAIEDLNLGIQYKPDHAVCYLNRSVLFNQKGDFASALSDINSYLKYKPYHADLWYEKARALRNLNRLQEALPAFGTAIKYNGRKGLYYYERGRTYYFMNKIAKAKKDIQYAISLGYQEIDPEIRLALGI